jgi:hypothetical protein
VEQHLRQLSSTWESVGYTSGTGYFGYWPERDRRHLRDHWYHRFTDVGVAAGDAAGVTALVTFVGGAAVVSLFEGAVAGVWTQSRNDEDADRDMQKADPSKEHHCPRSQASVPHSPKVAIT